MSFPVQNVCDCFLTLQEWTHIPRLDFPSIGWREGHLELAGAGGDEVGSLVLVTERVSAHHDRLGPPWTVEQKEETSTRDNP